jgi:hypothetical protein
MIKNYFYKALFLVSALASSTTQTNAACTFSKNLEIGEIQVGNLLTWTTSLETNHDVFKIEKSYDGLIFSEIGLVKSKGDSEKNQSYSFLDAGIGAQKAFYRMALRDKKGALASTSIFPFNRKVGNNFMIASINGTVTEKFFTVNIKSSYEAILQYSIVDQFSKVVRSGRLNMTSGNNVYSLDLSGIESNKVYEIVFNHDKEEERVTVQKVEAKAAPSTILMARDK